jgi:hypothetical protein
LSVEGPPFTVILLPLPLLLEFRPMPVELSPDGVSLLDGSAEPPHVVDSEPKPACDVSKGGSWLLLVLKLFRACFLEVSELLGEACLSGPPQLASAKASTDVSIVRSSLLLLVIELSLICFWKNQISELMHLI